MIGDYLFELNSLKRIKRSGWWHAGIKNPESVAEHSFGVAIVAHILASLEGEDANKLCAAAFFHDDHESRLDDIHKITAKYVKITKKLEQEIRVEQTQKLPEIAKKNILKTCNLSEKEKIILKDADYLDCAIQAKYYLDIGYSESITWIKNIEEKLQTNSAKKIFKELTKTKFSNWFKGLKNLDERK